MKKLISGFMVAWTLSLLFTLGVSAQGPTNINVTQIDTSRFPKVDVFVSVTDANGYPLRNVAPNAFRIEENGQTMAVTAASRSGEQGAVNTVLVIDRSGSMARGDKMAGAKQAASAFVNLMRPGDKSAVVQFDTEIDTLQSFTDDKNALLAAINQATPRGNTAMYEALNQAAKFLESTSGRKAVIVVTDGMDNSSRLNRGDVAKMASESSFSIYAIGLGAKGVGNVSQDGIDEGVLQEIASASMGAYYYRPEASQLSELYRQISSLIQNEYKLTYTSPNQLRDGLKRNIVVTAPSAAATRANFNPGGLIPEATQQWSSWLWFFVALLLLVMLLFAPTGLRLVHERGMPTQKAGMPAHKPRVKLTGGAPVPIHASGTKSVTQLPRIKIKGVSPAAARVQLPWEESTDKH
jgi:Ca-activated chloride channel homolog